MLSTRAALARYADEKRRRGQPVFCFQIGANDGKINDPVYPYLTGYGWSGLLVEPQVDVFERELKATYNDHPNVTLVNVALAPTEGSLPFYRVAISDARWATGLSGFRRDNIEHHIENGYIAGKAAADGIAMPLDPEKVIETIEVATTTVEKLLGRYGVGTFDLLCIDTEGYDFEILKMVDLAKYRPELILFESKNLSDADYATAKKMLGDAGYQLFWDNGDTFGVRADSEAARWMTTLRWRSSPPVRLFTAPIGSALRALGMR